MEFRLLIPSNASFETVPSTGSGILSPAYNTTTSLTPANTITIDGSSWALSDPLDIDNDSFPEYACISYKWGSDRHSNTLFPDKNMSTHAIPSLATAMRSQTDRAAYWTDVFCVPPDEGPARQATLENLGYIYARAAEVIVVLGSDTFTALQDMIQHKVVSEQNLQVLESDQWIASVWTYQEIVNAPIVRFVSEQSADANDPNAGATSNATQPTILVSDFLDALGHGLMRYRKSQSINPFALINKFPNLNVLENVLVDWMLGSYTRYSALTIFSNINYKRNETAANYYYSILGALSESPQQLIWPPNEADELLAEKMMKICESKSDFSFIYSVADRDPSPKRRWRPLATALPPDGAGVPPFLRPLLAWHYWGEAQSGTFNDNGELVLHNMTVMHWANPPAMSDIARTAIAKWTSRPDLPANDDAAIARILYTWFCDIQFEGDPNPIVVPDGLVFTLCPIEHDKVVDILISTEIRFSSGAPGLVRYLSSGNEKSYSPCLFVGAIDRLLEPGQSVLL